VSVTKNLIRRDAVSAVTMTGKVAAMNEVPGNFHFIAEIGHGGMSEVFLTIAQGGMEGFQKLVVVKLLRADLAEDEEFRRMFLDEARLSARLNHPNVVQTNAVGEDQGRYYIAMEYLEGQTFERARRTRGASVALTRNLQLQMLVDVLSGLHYAHELRDYDNSPMGIVHRDVTPSNVFLTYDGQVKLLDFGIARIRDSMNQTRVGVLKGKARYMAPEQIIGTPLDRRADIYSVGVMLWEVLSGKQIWRGRSEAETLRGVASGEFPALPPDAPEELQQICRTAMAYQPQRRYAARRAGGLHRPAGDPAPRARDRRRVDRAVRRGAAADPPARRRRAQGRAHRHRPDPAVQRRAGAELQRALDVRRQHRRRHGGVGQQPRAQRAGHLQRRAERPPAHQRPRAIASQVRAGR